MAGGCQLISDDFYRIAEMYPLPNFPHNALAGYNIFEYVLARAEVMTHARKIL